MQAPQEFPPDVCSMYAGVGAAGHAQSSLSSADGLGESIVPNDDRLQRRLEPPCDQSENLGPHPGVGFDHGALDGGVQMGLDEFADDGIEHMP